MAETRRLKELTRSVSSRLDLPDGPLVVALSGGADSAALAFLCVELGREPRALHVNHGLVHSETLASAAQSIADRLALDLEVVEVEVPEGSSAEAQARKVRYQAFADATREGEALLTAHTLDDDTETILMNLVRGTGSRGLSGIPRWRPPSIYRPVLDLRRTETREIAALAGLGFVDDPMNEDTALTRNWLRRVIIPQLETVNPRLAESVHRLGGLLAGEAGYLDGLALVTSPVLETWGAKLARGALLAAPEPVAGRVLMVMLGHLLGPAEVSADRVGRMWSVVRNEFPSQEIAGGVIAELDGPMFVVRRQAGDPAGSSPETLTPGAHRVGRYEFEVRAEPGPCRVMPLSRWAAIFPAGTELVARQDGVVTANGREAWVPGEKRLPVAWYEPGELGYLSVVAREGTGWTSSR